VGDRPVSRFSDIHLFVGDNSATRGRVVRRGFRQEERQSGLVRNGPGRHVRNLWWCAAGGAAPTKLAAGPARRFTHDARETRKRCVVSTSSGMPFARYWGFRPRAWRAPFIGRATKGQGRMRAVGYVKALMACRSGLAKPSWGGASRRILGLVLMREIAMSAGARHHRRVAAVALEHDEAAALSRPLGADRPFGEVCVKLRPGRVPADGTIEGRCHNSYRSALGRASSAGQRAGGLVTDGSRPWPPRWQDGWRFSRDNRR